MAPTAPTQPRKRFVIPLWPTVFAVLVFGAAIAALVFRGNLFQRADPLQGRTTATATRGSVVDQVTATGAIEPRVTAEMSFPSAGGRVEQVLVAENDSVAANQPLITLSTRRLEANVAAAEAGLAQAQADLQALRDGATPEQIAAAQAQVEAARGALVQTQGSVTTADVRAAQSRVAEAQALLTRLEAGPKLTDAQAADAELQQAQSTLQQQRDSLSTAKTNTQLALKQSADALVQAQTAFASATRDWEHVQATGDDPITGRGLNDIEKAKFYDAYVQAQATMQSAEASVQQAQIAFDNAQQAEITGIRTAEEQVRVAQANAQSIQAGADADIIQSARAQLATAQADLAKLQGQQRAGALQNQRGNLANAEAQLAELQADPKASDLARSEAQVRQAEAQLELARADLDDATLRAPFAGVVGTIGVAPGEIIGETTPMTLLDTSRYVVKLQVDEVDVSKVAVGQPVDVLIDALGAPVLQGIVLRITPQSQNNNNVTAYEVAVEIDPADRSVKPGMTASASIIAQKTENVVSVPDSAIRQENNQAVVDVVVGEGDDRTLAAKPVEVGLRAGGQAEIRSGLNEGEEVALP